ncbi:hypothetical protein HDE_13315 [Halotydeus destructor]|nr:hypothetical protein HDE_13315 [Halotydeus destructor]
MYKQERKPREKNFTADEKKLLLDLVGEHADIIRSRDKSTETNAKKAKAWASICLAFNATEETVYHRTSESLKKAWENLILNAKKDKSLANASLKQTGGGPATRVLSELSQAVVDTIGDELNPLSNPFDSDAGHHITLEHCDGQEIFVEDGEGDAMTDAKPQYFLSKLSRKRKHLQIEGHRTANDSLMAIREREHEMRASEHQMKMAKLRWEAMYWETRFQREFPEAIPISILHGQDVLSPAEAEPVLAISEPSTTVQLSSATKEDFLSM